MAKFKEIIAELWVAGIFGRICELALWIIAIICMFQNRFDMAATAIALSVSYKVERLEGLTSGKSYNDGYNAGLKYALGRIKKAFPDG